MKLKKHDVADISIHGTTLKMRVDGKDLQVDLLEHSYRLGTCTDEHRQNVEVVADGAGLYWPDVDEILPVYALTTDHFQRALKSEEWEKVTSSLRNDASER